MNIRPSFTRRPPTVFSGGAVCDALIARCAVQAGGDRIFTGNTRHYHLLGEVSKRIGSPVLDQRKLRLRVPDGFAHKRPVARKVGYLP